jgi:hypothetical protein
VAPAARRWTTRGFPDATIGDVVTHQRRDPAMSVLQSIAAGYEVGHGRLVPSMAALVGLSSAVAGGLALARAGRSGAGNRRTAAFAAVVAGLLSAVVGGVHALNAAGGLGTGNGLAGAVVALALGLIGLGLGGLALARSRGAAVGSAPR